MMGNPKVAQLAHKVNDLILLCEQMSQENKTLKVKEENWQLERQKLELKNTLAKKRISDMLDQLRSVEQA